LLAAGQQNRSELACAALKSTDLPPIDGRWPLNRPLQALATHLAPKSLAAGQLRHWRGY